MKKNSGSELRFEQAVRHGESSRLVGVGKAWSLKRKDLIKLLERNGWWFKHEGGNHTIYTNGIDCEPVSRQCEIKEHVAQKIIKRRSLK